MLSACLGVMAGFGSLFVYTFSVFVKPLAAEFGWSREAISSGFAIAAVTLGVCSPLLGRWIDRFGPRRIILLCMTIYGFAIASLSLLRSRFLQVYVTCFVLGVVGNGAAHLAFSRSISTWFQRRLGMALALVMVSCLSWKWRKRSSVKITERTYEEGTEAFHSRRKSSHPEAASCGQSTRLGVV